MDSIELQAAADPVAEDDDMPLPSDPKLLLQLGQFLIILMAALYTASSIVLPIVLSLLLKLLLEPVMRGMERLRVPRPLAAILLILVVMASIVMIVTALSGPAEAWAAKLPSGLPRLQERLNFLAQPVGTLMQFLQRAENIARETTAGQHTEAVTVQGPGLSSTLFAGTASFASGFFTTMLLLFFLLTSGDIVLRRLVELLPRFRDKRQVVTITKEIERNISAYLFTITVMNMTAGLATAGAMWLCGLANPLLWGVLAFLLNYVPILGPMICLCVLAFAGLLSIDSVPWAFLPAGAYLLIHVVEGQVVTPHLVAHRFTLNPVIVVISLIFWYWMWGVPGAILAVPLLAMTKIVCDGVRPWSAFGHLIGG